VTGATGGRASGKGGVPTQLDIIPFHDTDVLAVQVNDKPYVLLKPAFEAIGVDADRQIKNVQKRSWACTAVTAVQLGGQVRNMIAADIRTFLMALATIPASRVKPEVRPLLEAYQAEVADVIEAYYAKGMAPINPRVEPDQVPAVVAQAVGEYRSAREQQIAEDEAERAANARVSAAQINLINMAMSFGLIDSQWGQTKAQVILARGIGETPNIKAADMPLYVEDFMKSKGVSQSKISRFSGAFGKKVMAQALTDGSPLPGKRTQDLPNGTIREVTAWTKDHLPIFERAWASSYANDWRVTG
jgi:hypothetical protein